MTLAKPEAQPKILHHSFIVDRHDLNPDTIIEHYSRAIRSLENAVEEAEVAADWETLRVTTRIPRLADGEVFPADVAVISADVAILS